MPTFSPFCMQLPSSFGGQLLSMSYSDSTERVRHVGVMESLAVELGRSIAEIMPLYEDVLVHLRDQAQIQDYLPILVSKRVKLLLKN